MKEAEALDSAVSAALLVARLRYFTRGVVPGYYCQKKTDAGGRPLASGRGGHHLQQAMSCRRGAGRCPVRLFQPTIPVDWRRPPSIAGCKC